jgi:hypothetical protein
MLKTENLSQKGQKLDLIWWKQFWNSINVLKWINTIFLILLTIINCRHLFYKFTLYIQIICKLL